jgi:hypothetical protein
MTREEYEAAICARRHQAIYVPFRPVSIDAWTPGVAECHRNADTWVKAHPDWEVVRGWVTYASFGGDSVGLTAHSVVRDRSGILFDITPLLDETLRAGMRFIEHEGDANTFFMMKTRSINIHCLDFGGWDGSPIKIEGGRPDEEDA